MKKAAKAKAVMMAADIASPTEMKPQVRFDISEENVGALSKLKIGDKVTAQITGTVVSISSRETPEYSSSDADVEGDMAIEIDTIAVDKDGKNVFSEMAAEEDEG